MCDRVCIIGYFHAECFLFMKPLHNDIYKPLLSEFIRTIMLLFYYYLTSVSVSHSLERKNSSTAGENKS